MRLDSNLPGTGAATGGSGGGLTALNLFRTGTPSASGQWSTSGAGRSFVRTSALDDLNRPSSIVDVTFQIACAPSAGYDLSQMCVAELDPNDPTMFLGSAVPVTFNGQQTVSMPAGSIITSDTIPWAIDLTTFNGFWFGFVGSGYTTREDNRPGTGGAHQNGVAACDNVSMSQLSRTYLIFQITGGLV